MFPILAWLGLAWLGNKKMSSRFWRTSAFNFVIGTSIEFAICYCVSIYFNNESQAFYALLIMLGLWAVQVGLWLKNLLVATVHYYLVGKRQLANEVEISLHQLNFPIYQYGVPDSVDYFSQVIKDQNSNVDQIVFAASSLGQIQLLKMSKPTGAMRFMGATEMALDNYYRNSHKRRQPDSWNQMAIEND
jgi:hypothetical protein